MVMMVKTGGGYFEARKVGWSVSGRLWAMILDYAGNDLYPNAFFWGNLMRETQPDRWDFLEYYHQAGGRGRDRVELDFNERMGL
jgi:hypothetical protein